MLYLIFGILILTSPLLLIVGLNLYIAYKASKGNKFAEKIIEMNNRIPMVNTYYRKHDDE
jgi:hypothetical protein